MLFPIAGCFSAAGMGLWHGVEHWEMNKINVESQTELFVKAWPDVSTLIMITFRAIFCYSSQLLEQKGSLL
jgi:hypothetical protein